jgi:LmbE family N-acetylglucosaminyl deacetylase
MPKARPAVTPLQRALRQFDALFPQTPAIPSVRRYLAESTVVILSPHPDDEILSGGLALRLQDECRMRVVNVAVTLGSNPQRKRARRLELAKATRRLGWENVVLPEDWQQKKKRLTALLKRLQPALIIAPHVRDHHPSHVRTAELALDWLKRARPTTTVAWAEYWGPLAKPNFLLEIPRPLLERQIHALECHVGEISRNPYHLRLPAWQMDNVRRGSELVAGKGTPAPSFAFGQLYRLERWEQGRARGISGLILDRNEDPSDVL